MVRLQDVTVTDNRDGKVTSLTPGELGAAYTFPVLFLPPSASQAHRAPIHLQPAICGLFLKHKADPEVPLPHHGCSLPAWSIPDST